MERSDVDRRHFNRLAMAALSGMVAGTVSGCSPGGGAGPAADSDAAKPDASDAETEMAKADPNLMLEEPHVCRGLNTCKGKGKGGDNACAGQGACASVEPHSCHGQNACKGQGGCGSNPGQNACKGNGGCSVPLHEGAWEKARADFEKLMKEKGKEIGAAPDKT